MIFKRGNVFLKGFLSVVWEGIDEQKRSILNVDSKVKLSLYRTLCMV